MSFKRAPPPPPVGNRTQLSLSSATNGATTNGNLNTNGVGRGIKLQTQTNHTTKPDESNNNNNTTAHNNGRQVNFGASDPRAELLASPPDKQVPRSPLQRQQSTDSIKSPLTPSKSGIVGQDRSSVSATNGTSISQRPSRPLSVGLARSPMNIQRMPASANTTGIGVGFLEERRRLKEQQTQSLQAAAQNNNTNNTNNNNSKNTNNNNSGYPNINMTNSDAGVRFTANPNNNVRRVEFGTARPNSVSPNPNPRIVRPNGVNVTSPRETAPPLPPRDEGLVLPPPELPPPDLPPPDLPPPDLPPPIKAPNPSPTPHNLPPPSLRPGKIQLPPPSFPPPQVPPPQTQTSQNHSTHANFIRSPSQELVAVNRSLPPPPPPEGLPPPAMDVPLPPPEEDVPPLPPRDDFPPQIEIRRLDLDRERANSSSSNGYNENNSECESGEDEWANLEASILAGSVETIKLDSLQSPRARNFFDHTVEDEESSPAQAFDAFNKNMQKSTTNINSSAWAEEFLSRQNTAALEGDLYTGGEMGKAGIIEERKARLNSPNILGSEKKPEKTRVQSVKDVRQVLKQFETPQQTAAVVTEAKSKKDIESLKSAGNVKEKNQMIQKSMNETNTPTTPNANNTRLRSTTLKTDQRLMMLEKQFTSPTPATNASQTATTSAGMSSSAGPAFSSGSSIGFSSTVNPGITKLRTGTISGPPGVANRPQSYLLSSGPIDHTTGYSMTQGQERRGTVIGPSVNLGTKMNKSLPEIPPRKVVDQQLSGSAGGISPHAEPLTPTKKDDKKKTKEEKKEEKKRLAEQKKREKEEQKNLKKGKTPSAPTSTGTPSTTPPPPTQNNLSRSMGKAAGNKAAIKTKPVVKTRIVRAEDLDPRVYLFEEPDSDQNILFTNSSSTSDNTDKSSTTNNNTAENQSPEDNNSNSTNNSNNSAESDTGSDNMRIHGAVIHKLIQRLTYDKYPDPKFVNIFLLTYRSFATPSELLFWLKLRFDTPQIEGVDHETFMSSKQMQIRLRVFNVIKQWVSNHWDDFSTDTAIIQDLQRFIDHVMIPEGMVNPGEQLKNLIKKQLHNAQYPSDKKLQFSKNPPPPFLPSNLKTSIDVLNLHPEEVARQLTLIEEKLYKAIEPSECLGLKWMKDDKETSAKHIISLISRFNDVSRWVASSIVEIYDIKPRAVMMNRFITIAVKCFELNNFNCVMEILSGLQNASVYRLKATFATLPKKTWELFEELNEVMTSHENFKVLRAKLHSVNPPCIPYLGIFLTDLTFIQQGNADYLAKSNLINFTKMKYVARVIGEIQQYQQPPYCLEPVQPIQDYLLTGVKLCNDNELYEHSLKCEPKKPKK